MNSEFQTNTKASKEVSEKVAQLSPAKRALLELRLKKAMGNKFEKDTIPQRKERETAPLSYAQQRLWFLYQLDPESSYYNIPAAWRLKGLFNIEAMHRAINAIVERHEAIRTTFVMSDGEPMQKISRCLTIDLPLTDLSNDNTEARELTLKRLCTEEARWVFDLSKGPLLKCSLFRLEAETHVLMLNIHHIISDGWSMDILYRELWEFYETISNGKSSSFPALSIQYADYAEWQRKWLQGDVLEKQLHYWKERLADAPPLLELQTDRPRPVMQSFRGARHKTIMPESLLEGLKTLSRKEGCTLYMTLLAAFQLLLHRYTGQDDILVGSPIAGRNHSGIENLIGFFVNTIILRTDFSGNPTFGELLGRVRETALGAYEHQDLPFEKLVEELKPERSLDRSPLVQVVFALQNTIRDVSDFSQLLISRERIDVDTAKFDLTLFMYEVGKKLHASLEYSTDLFNQATIERMMVHFQTLLEAIVFSPEKRVSELPILTESEQYQLLVEWNGTYNDYPKALCVHQLFELQAAQTPENVAVIFGKERLTYARLNARANQLAHYLSTCGVGPETRVGICAERSLEMIVGLLGVLKAGGAYVPLDPAYPLERLTFMIEDAQVEILLTQRKQQGLLPEFAGPVVLFDGNQERIGKEPSDNLIHTGSGDQLAYVMYTSGSTGKPKGVAVVHKGIVRLVKETNYADLSPDEVFLQFAPISFDASTFEIWGALLNGARLVIFPSYLPSLQELGKVLKQYGVTTLWLTAGLFHQMVTNHLEGLKPVRQLLAGGDVLSAPLVKKALGALKGCRLINGYGPTENTTFTCCHVMTDPKQVGDSVPIGRPIANTQVYIIDDYLQPVPIGVVGELYIGGDGLARGYLNQPELTQEKFIENPFSTTPDSRLYKSGDLVRYRADGTIEFLGRKDTQVKIRGFRIELGEIEAVIAGHPSVREVAAIVREDVPGDKRIVAYVVYKAGESMDVESLRSYLQNKIPGYMVPSVVVALDVLPLNANGKVDRKGLPVPGRRQTTGNPENQKPRDPIEIQLAKIWEKALGVESVGIRDNFFNLGGHSLLAVQVLSQIKKAMGKEISVGDLFKSPTIERLSDVIRHKTESLPLSHIRPYQVLGHKPSFYCIFIAAADAARLIDLEQPFYGGAPHGFDGRRIPSRVKNIAIDFIKEIKAIQPEGPYFIGGYSFGGIVAYEIAYQLQIQGEKIGILILIDPTTPGQSSKPPDRINKAKGPIPDPGPLVESSPSLFEKVRENLKGLSFRRKIKIVFKKAWKKLMWDTGIEKEIRLMFCRILISIGLTVPIKLREEYSLWFYRKISHRYTPHKYEGEAVLLKCTDGFHAPDEFWRQYVLKKLEVYEIPGGHLDIFKEPYIREFAKRLKTCLDTAQKKSRKKLN